MKIEINITDDTLSDYLIEVGEELTFTDVFKDEIKNTILNRINWSDAIQKLIREELHSELCNKIQIYKNEEAIRAFTEEIIRKEMAPQVSGSFYFSPTYKHDVETAVKKEMQKYRWDVDEATRIAFNQELKSIIDDIVENTPFREFLDVPKLTAYVRNVMKERGVDSENN